MKVDWFTVFVGIVVLAWIAIRTYLYFLWRELHLEMQELGDRIDKIYGRD